MAPSSTLERVRRLEARGVIRAYRAVIDPDAVGFGVLAVVMINLAGHQSEAIERFEHQVRALDEVVACLHVTGRYDYLLQVVAHDMQHLRDLITRDLAAIGGVQKQETFLVLATAKGDEGYPLARTAQTTTAGRRAATPSTARRRARRRPETPDPADP